MLVLTMACMNAASMMLAVGESRQREIGVCAALGASRGRLVRQLMFESIGIATLAGPGGA